MSIKVENLSFSYGKNQVLNNISFSAEYGEFISVLGPNGVGKSTLFRCMLGLLEPSSGNINVDGNKVDTLSPRQLARYIAYIPQSHQPVFNYSVFDVVLMGTTAQTGSFSSPGKKQRKLVEAALEKLGIIHLSQRSYGKLSGGERQLTLIARAIAQQAKIIIMDEPSASLDFGNRIHVMQVVKSLAKDGYCIIQSTNDPEQAYMYSDKILALYNGNLLSWGSPEETINEEVISKLYGVDVELCSMFDDTVRICVPKERSFIK